MIKSNSFPKCINPNTLLECYNQKKIQIITNNFVNKFIEAKPFDVTLRDGLQSLNYDEQKKITYTKKIQIYQYLITKYNPYNLEIGSCINKKVSPIFGDTEHLFKYAEENKKKLNLSLHHYVLISNIKQLMNSLKFGATNFSFTTSLSNSFQYNHSMMTKHENFTNLNNMMIILENLPSLKLTHTKTGNASQDLNLQIYKVKLYLNCINECPIEGKIPLDKIIGELYTLNKMKFDKICLYDTCGTLTHQDFLYILENAKKVGINIENLTLHLLVKPEREYEIEEIFHTALDYGINEFDVSDINTFGDSEDADKDINKNKYKDKITPNMSYEQYYKFLNNYLIK
jgi:hypothetical protein